MEGHPLPPAVPELAGLAWLPLSEHAAWLAFQLLLIVPGEIAVCLQATAAFGIPAIYRQEEKKSNLMTRALPLN